MENVKMPHLIVRPDWLARNLEDPLEPERPIIDPHHHLWERPDARYLFHDLHEDVTGGHDVQATVYIQCRSMHRAGGPEEMRPVGEVEFVVGAAAMADSGHYGPCRICAGIVATCDLTLGDKVPAVLDALDAASGGRLRGIRQPVAVIDDPAIIGSVVTPPPGLLATDAMAEGVREMGRRGLVLDIWAFQTQLGEALALAKAAPETTIVIDHCGGVLGIGDFTGTREANFPKWKDDMAALAAQPNVRVKLGGLAMPDMGYGWNLRDRPASSDELVAAQSRWYDHAIACFGAERCMFESNFPVDKGAVSYPVVWNAFKRIAAGASADEKAKLFHDTAKRVYRL